jgi:hypothetical protein
MSFDDVPLVDVLPTDDDACWVEIELRELQELVFVSKMDEMVQTCL